ncbi:hypothetical protein [Streptomyces sp. NPDC002889]|uniref:hypothetical protein n=1 Tax=Streptomyces sp. NPDC002889 TaxID=3364669 RepID=UPI00368D7597
MGRLFSRRVRDEARTERLLAAADKAFDNPDADFSDGSFEAVVLHGVAADPTRPYPPAGHPYPR